MTFIDSSLPNLHPALVHFPIAWLPLAVAVDLAALALRRQTWLDRAAALLYASGAAGAGLAVWFGERAEETLLDLAPAAQAALAEHAERGDFTFWAAVLVAALRLFCAWRDRAAERLRVDPLRLVALAAAAITLWLLAGTALRGGALVYRHAIGVTAPGPPL